jgi:hypothetical protein
VAETNGRALKGDFGAVSGYNDFAQNLEIQVQRWTGYNVNRILLTLRQQCCVAGR